MTGTHRLIYTLNHRLSNLWCTLIMSNVILTWYSNRCCCSCRLSRWLTIETKHIRKVFSELTCTRDRSVLNRDTTTLSRGWRWIFISCNDLTCYCWCVYKFLFKLDRRMWSWCSWSNSLVRHSTYLPSTFFWSNSSHTFMILTSWEESSLLRCSYNFGMHLIWTAIKETAWDTSRDSADTIALLRLSCWWNLFTAKYPME